MGTNCRWWSFALLSSCALIVAVSVVSLTPQGGEWEALLQKKIAESTGWSRLPGHGDGLVTLWHTEKPKKVQVNGWGRMPENHKPGNKHVLRNAGHHRTLTHELPLSYHLPAESVVTLHHNDVPKKDRLVAEELARNLHAYHKEQMMATSNGHLGPHSKREVISAKLNKKKASLPAGYHILKPGQKLPLGAKIVKAPPHAGYEVPGARGIFKLKPGMKLPAGAKIVQHPHALAQRSGALRRAKMNIPRVGPGNHMLDEEGGDEAAAEAEGCEECAEGDEDCVCPPPSVSDVRVANVTVVEPTADERLIIAEEDHRRSRAERIEANALKKKVYFFLSTSLHARRGAHARYSGLWFHSSHRVYSHIFSC